MIPDQKGSTLAPLKEEKSPYNLPQTARDGAQRGGQSGNAATRCILSHDESEITVARMTACCMSDYVYLKLNT